MLRASGLGGSLSALLVASVFFVLAIGVFVFVRGVSGAMSMSLPVPQLLATAAGLCVWAVAVRELGAKRGLYFWAPPAAMLLIAIGCTSSGHRAVDWLVWLTAIAFVTRSPLMSQLKWRRPVGCFSPPQQEQKVLEHFSQQLTRVRTAEGKDVVRGTLVAEFLPGARQTSLYVGFCPPFELVPTVDVMVTGDFEADVKTVQVLHNGAQFDVRLSEAAEEPIAITIEFVAVEGTLS